MTMSALEEHLRKLEELVDTTPQCELQEHCQLIKRVCKKLNKRQNDPTLSLLEHLNISWNIIEGYAAQTVDAAVKSLIDWSYVDLRIIDIRLGTNKQTSLVKFRKGLGERSLALQYHNWEISDHGFSRLEALCTDPANCRDVTDGKITAFVHAHALSEMECVTKAIQHGTKLLLLERLFGSSSISALLFFVFRHFRAVKYVDTDAMVEQLRRKSSIVDFTKRIEPWFWQCCAAYDMEVTTRKQLQRQHVKHSLVQAEPERMAKRPRVIADSYDRAHETDTQAHIGGTSAARVEDSLIAITTSPRRDSVRPTNDGSDLLSALPRPQQPGHETDLTSNDASPPPHRSVQRTQDATPADPTNGSMSMPPSFVPLPDDFWEQFQYDLFNSS